MMYNSMFTQRFIHYLDNDEKKGKKEQAIINKQKDIIDQLESEIRDAKVGCCFLI